MEREIPLVTPSAQRGQISQYVGLDSSPIDILQPSTAEWSQFLEAHPETAEDLAFRIQDHTDELKGLDETNEIDRVTLYTIAADCKKIMDADVSYDVKRTAFQAKLGSIVRLQIPSLATQECVVYKKASELDRDFELDQALLYREGNVTLDELSRMENPADALLATFRDHVEESYDFTVLEANAARSLTGFMDEADARSFEAIVRPERIDDPARVTLFGADVTARVVTLVA